MKDMKKPGKMSMKPMMKPKEMMMDKPVGKRRAKRAKMMREK